MILQRSFRLHLAKYTALVGWLLISIGVSAQNLLPNGGFETYTICPNGPANIIQAVSYSNPTGGTPDFFHSCASVANSSVPSNWYGFQPAHGGQGYGGMILYYGPGVPNGREYIQAALQSPMDAGQCYHVEFWINRCNRSRYASDNVQVYFSNTQISGIPGLSPLAFTPQVQFNILSVIDTVNWTYLSGNFTATGNEQFVIFGNFLDDASTTTAYTNAGGQFDYSFHYIDDISITPCTGLADNPHQTVTVTPTLFHEQLTVTNYQHQPVLFTLYDASMKLILVKKIYTSEHMATEHLRSGMYFYTLQSANGEGVQGKLVKR